MTDADFQRAFDEHKDAVYRFAWRMSSSPAAAEDVTQEAFLALLMHPQRFDPARGSLRSFLLGIARNLTLKRWRAEHRFDALDEDQFMAEPPSRQPVVSLADFQPVDEVEIALWEKVK